MSDWRDIIVRADALSEEAGGGDIATALAFLLDLEDEDAAVECLRVAVNATADRIQRARHTSGFGPMVEAIQTGVELGVAAERMRRAAA